MPALAEPLDPPASDALSARLDDPRVSASLMALLEHADLLAVLVAGLDGLVRRSDTITDSVADGVKELRSVAGGAGLPDINSLIGLGRAAAEMTGPLTAALPTLGQLLDSDITDPAVVDLAALVSRAALRGAQEAQAGQLRVHGIRALLQQLKNDDVSRALGFVFAIARALGRELAQPPLRAD